MQTTEKNTPLMEQYFEIKAQYHDTLVLFQVGDFYELFFDDAKQASAILAITLTKRGKNKGMDIPLCGIPVHALNHYLRKLIKAGFKVALCDQLSKPIPGTVVKRGITQVFTPGTLTDSLMLDEKSASYLLSFYPGANEWGLLFTELLTAQLFATTIPAESYKMVESELIRYFPDEIILPQTSTSKPYQQFFKKLGFYTNLTDAQTSYETAGQPISRAWVESQFNHLTLTQLKQHESILYSLDTLYFYLKKNQGNALSHFKTIQFYESNDYLILDAATQKNLEIIQNNQDGKRKNSLFAIMDKAKTPMGSRMLKKWLLRPLVSQEALLQRLQVVTLFYKQITFLQQLEELLSQISDLERIIGRIALRRALLNDYLALKESLTIIPDIKAILAGLSEAPLAKAINEKLSDFSPLIDLLTCSLNDDSNFSHSIKKGFDYQLDHLRNLVENGQQEILKLEQEEIKRTKIASLKIRYNNISGYYIEITDANLHLVPADYKHQQTLVNKKRFTTPQLTDLERDLFKAQHEIDAVEAEVFTKVKDAVEQQLIPLRHLAQALAYLDSLFSLAKLAYENKYVAPSFNDKQEIIIKGGRHPVIEMTQAEKFIKNDTLLNQETSIYLITGPNMGGKSTYLRQVALICIMAQCGSFIPANAASLPLLDRIFTRIGSGDNLAEGKSTFLVEMEETATICNQATKKSLVILDEVGRGTSTFDGIALAQAIIEHICIIGAQCLFATHFHELTALESKFNQIKNYSMYSIKKENRLHFFHTIKPEVADKSFGLEVAKLAQLPPSIIQRAEILLQEMEQNSSLKLFCSSCHENTSNNYIKNGSQEKILSLEQELHRNEIALQELRSIDLNSITPKQALDILWELQKKV